MAFSGLVSLIVTTEEGNTSTHYALSGAAPSTITAYGNFSTTYGTPGLRVYVGGSSPSLVDVKSATSTEAGSSAVFPFPTQSSGSPLGEGFYGLVSTSVNSAGNAISTGSPSYLAIGGSTTLSSAFGVDAADITVNTVICVGGYGGSHCGNSGGTSAVPIVAQYNANQVSYTSVNLTNGVFGTLTVPVGVRPVATKLYGTYTATYGWNFQNGNGQRSATGPSNAIVVNSGSNNVSLINFAKSAAVTNIAVGTQPMAVALNSGATMAYVANYGSGTLSEVNLSTATVSRTSTVGTGPLSVAMDPNGAYVWVGASNYLYKVSLSTFTVAASYPVSGSVTSLAASNTQNELVYTLVQNCCSAASTYAANEMLLSNLSNPGTYAHATAAPFAPYTMNGTLPSAAVLPQASSVVSARFSNGMGASATPTGFVIYDLISHKQIMTGTTPTPVRGIASDPDCMFAYFTLPDSNEYIAVPLESTP